MIEILKKIFGAVITFVLALTGAKEKEIDPSSESFQPKKFVMTMFMVAFILIIIGESVIIFRISERNMKLSEKIEEGCTPATPPGLPPPPDMPGLHVPKEPTRINLKHAPKLGAMEKGP